MERGPHVRPAVPADAGALAVCQVVCRRETSSHLLSASLVRTFVADQGRQRQWQGLVDGDHGARVVVAEAGGVVVGYATSGPSRDDPVLDLQLCSLYLRAAHHGAGLGHGLLDAAIGERACALWMAEDDPRAGAFYARNGFLPDGARTTEPAWEDLPEVRLVR